MFVFLFFSDPSEAIISFSETSYEFTLPPFDGHCISVSASSTIEENIKYTSASRYSTKYDIIVNFLRTDIIACV